MRLQLLTPREIQELRERPPRRETYRSSLLFERHKNYVAAAPAALRYVNGRLPRVVRRVATKNLKILFILFGDHIGSANR